ncbi:MAG: hypothetical protein HY000_34425 [Planctomycetes bacterium]|nr:hypothetical protein [Planctomycetota bacterium]
MAVSSSYAERGKKSWQTRRRKAAWVKAKAAEAASKVAVEAALKESGYRCVFFEGPTGSARTGIVDGVAIRIAPGDKDRLEVLLLQLKGGKAGASAREITRLQQAVQKLKVDWNIAVADEEHVHFLSTSSG